MHKLRTLDLGHYRGRVCFAPIFVESVSTDTHAPGNLPSRADHPVDGVGDEGHSLSRQRPGGMALANG